MIKKLISISIPSIALNKRNAVFFRGFIGVLAQNCCALKFRLIKKGQKRD
jgi:hypothetical protein